MHSVASLCAGQRVGISGKQCEVIRRRTRIGLWQAIIQKDDAMGLVGIGTKG